MSVAATEPVLPALTVDEMRERVTAHDRAATGQWPGQALRRFLRAAIWGIVGDEDMPGTREALAALLGVYGTTVFRLPRLGFGPTSRRAVDLGLVIEAMPSTVDEPYTVKPGAWVDPEEVAKEAHAHASTAGPGDGDPFVNWVVGNAYGSAGSNTPGLALHRALCSGAAISPDTFGSRARCADFLGVSPRRYTQILARTRLDPVLKYAHVLGMAVQVSPGGVVVTVDP